MPPKLFKQKSAKDSEKNKKKNSAVDDPESPEVKDDQLVPTTATPTGDLVTEEIKPEETSPIEEIDIKYKEPVLTLLIVENYEGEKNKGFFEGFGKAQFKGGHRYEGDFHNGMMHGKGTYIWADGIIYEGEFLNNEIIGTGKYLWPSDQHKYSTYEGGVYKGKRRGLGTFKSGLTSIVYVGEWISGKRYGKGKMMYGSEGVSYYEGDWIDNKKFGWGVRHYPSGNIYEGMWVNNVRHGEGTMRWFDKSQTYTGQWENGVQNGSGEHNWYLGRVELTQYSLRNTFYGNFLNGKKNGQGTFLYADGAKYEGCWENNLKHGYGKYIYKDGKVYEGYFEEDKMTDTPTYNRISKFSGQLAKVKTRMPSAGTTLNIQMLRENGKVNRADFNLNLDLSSILGDFKKDDEKNLESVQAQKTIIRYLDLFKQIYRFYSQLGMDMSPDNTYILNRMQFWRYLKDCNIHLNEKNLTLMEFDRLLNHEMNPNDLHCPFDKILIREFFNYNVLIAYHLYKDQFKGEGLIISWCIKKLIEDNILKFSCNVRGDFYKDTRKTLNTLSYMIKAFDIYRRISKKRKRVPFDSSFTMRNFVCFLREFKLIDNKTLSTKDIVEILAVDNQLVYDFDNAYNLDHEITFLEFFEALIGCALVSYREEKIEDDQTVPNEVKNSTESDSLNVQKEASTDFNNEAIHEKHQSNISRPIISAKNTEIQTERTQKEMKREDTRVSFFEKDESYQNTNRPSTGSEIHITLEAETEENDPQDEEIRIWINKNHIFFIKKFFPAVENYEKITQFVNKSL